MKAIKWTRLILSLPFLLVGMVLLAIGMVVGGEDI